MTILQEAGYPHLANHQLLKIVLRQMKQLKIIILCLCASIGIFATSAAETHPSAAETMRMAAGKIKKMASFEASFKVNAYGKSTVGQITVSGNKFKLTTPQLSTWFDGKVQWTYSPATLEVSISEPTPDELAQINPFEIISSLQNGYTFRLMQSSDGIEKIELTPKHKGEYAKIIISLDSTTLLPEEVISTASDNTVTKVTISSVKAVKSPSISTFRFNPRLYPGVEIIDLR